MVHKKKKSDKNKTGHKQDFYPTPLPLIWELLKTKELDNSHIILDPCCGTHAIDNELKKSKRFDKVIGKDIIYGDNFLKSDYKYGKYDTVVMNPPFELFDDFLIKAKETSPRVITIGKTDLFSAYQRFQNGLWEHLKHIYIFDRKVDYSNTELSEKITCGMMTTAWFVFDESWDKSWWKTSIIDVQEYVK